MRTAGAAMLLSLFLGTCTVPDDPGPLHLLEGHDKAVLAVAFSRDGERVATGSESGLTRIWDPKTGDLLLDLEFQYSINGLVFTREGRELMTATWNAQIWDLGDGTRKNHLEAHTGFLTCVAIASEGKQIATGGLDSTVKLWVPGSWQEIRSLKHADQVNAVAFSGDGKSLTVAGDTTVTVWDTVTWKSKRSITGKPATAVAMNKDGTLVVIGRADGSLQVYETAEGKQLRDAKPHKDKVTSAQVSPDGKLIGTASADKTASLLSFEDLKERVAWPHPEAVTSIAFAPNGKSAATGCRDGTGRIWKVSETK